MKLGKILQLISWEIEMGRFKEEMGKYYSQFHHFLVTNYLVGIIIQISVTLSLLRQIRKFTSAEIHLAHDS